MDKKCLFNHFNYALLLVKLEHSIHLQEHVNIATHHAIHAQDLLNLNVLTAYKGNLEFFHPIILANACKIFILILHKIFVRTVDQSLLDVYIAIVPQIVSPVILSAMQLFQLVHVPLIIKIVVQMNTSIQSLKHVYVSLNISDLPQIIARYVIEDAIYAKGLLQIVLSVLINIFSSVQRAYSSQNQLF